MPAVRRVLVVGAGVGGCAVAALLAEAGVEVQLVEQKSELAGIGSGISLQGNAMRVLRQIGVWDEVRDNGYAFDSLAFRAPDEHGSLVAEVQDARTGGPDLPAGLGIYRATLADILARRVRQLGGQIRFSASPTKLMDHRDEVEVAFRDGSIEGYDLVIGADGVNSAVRRLIGIELSPRSSGIGVWRVFVPRPASVTRTELYYGGPSNLAGYTPTGQDWMYAFISEPATDRSAMTQQEQLALMRELATAYHGPWDDIRASMTEDLAINYTVPQSHLLDRPWNRGRVVVIGDAAHSCPPSLAQGAAQALEDAVVLAELLNARECVDEGLWEEFMDRRYERVRLVVQSSNQLNAWQLNHEQGDAAAVMGRVAGVLSQPA